MEEFIEKLLFLLKQDQDAIKSFRGGEITKEELTEKSLAVSKNFLNCVKFYGFPYKNQVKEDIYKAAITLSLHLDLVDLWDIFINYIKDQSSNCVSLSDKAFFIDKIRILSGQSQLYGTQYKIDENRNIELIPLEDKNNIDKIREDAGLRPLSEYIDFARQSLGK